MATDTSDSPTSILEFPGKFSGEEAAIDVCVLAFAAISLFLSFGLFSSTLDNAQLLGLVRQWDLRPAKRNRASYVQVLKDFSTDRSAWTK
jgi:hypothetical protein